MTDNQGNHPAGPVDPARAFDALRRTVTDLRGAVEARQKHLDAELAITRRGIETAFEKLSAIREPVDYSADMARLLKSLDGVDRRAKALGETPALNLGPDENDRILTRAGEDHMQSAADSIETATRDVDEAAGFIEDHLRSARTRQIQDREIVTKAAVCSVVGGLVGLLFGMLMLYLHA